MFRIDPQESMYTRLFKANDQYSMIHASLIANVFFVPSLFIA